MSNIKILELDIETAPHSAYIWSLWTKYIAPDHVEVPGYVLCFAARWRGQKKVHFHSVWKDGLKGMAEAAHALLDEADAVVHYNGRKFDIPMLNTEFLLQDMKPPAPFKEIDLLPTVRKNFRFPSNKLDYVCRRLGLGAKISHRGMDLWTEVMQGEKTACKEMMEYNKQDVVLLEPLYNRLLPWIAGHPNLGLFMDSDVPVCSKCGSKHIHYRGYQTMATQKYRRYQCQECGAWDRERFTAVSRDKSRLILAPIAR